MEERKGAAYHIKSTRPQQIEQPSGGMRPMNPWYPNSGEGEHSYTFDDRVALSVSHHPSGGYRADVSNSSWDAESPDDFQAGPFRTPLRAQVAAESLAERTRSIGRGVRGDIDSYRRRA